MRYAFIEHHRGEDAISTMCRVVEASKAGSYAWRFREPSVRTRGDFDLVAITAKHKASRSTYGSPLIHADLQAEGIGCGRKRVARLMRGHAIRSASRRRFCVTTQSQHAHPVAINILNQKFNVDLIATTNRVWAGDITYIPTHEGWLYLAVILDLYSRRIVDCAMRSSLDRSLAIAALTMALRQRQRGSGLLFHSDHGTPYACAEFQSLLQKIESPAV